MDDRLPTDQDPQLERALAVKRAYTDELMRKPNVVAVGVGYRRRGGGVTQEPAIIVSVIRKQVANELGPDDLIPTELDGVPVDVQETGVISAGGE